jgi:hypothetical protein
MSLFTSEFTRLMVDSMLSFRWRWRWAFNLYYIALLCILCCSHGNKNNEASTCVPYGLLHMCLVYGSCVLSVWQRHMWMPYGFLVFECFIFRMGSYGNSLWRSFTVPYITAVRLGYYEDVTLLFTSYDLARNYLVFCSCYLFMLIHWKW